MSTEFYKDNKVQVDVGGKRVKAKIVKQNSLTVLVRLSDGNIIKRHKIKHNMAPHVSVFER